MVRVLVVDDAPEIVQLLSSQLTGQGYDVSAAHNGREALEVAAASPPDVILLDVKMPGMDGIEVCRRLKADRQLGAIPVILVTVKDADEDVVAGLDAGADDYVIKPFNNEILSARLRSAARAKGAHDTIARMNEELRAEIAERKLLEQELAQSQKMEAVGRLAAGIAHEVNTPIQYLGDNAHFLQGAFDDIGKLVAMLHWLLETAKHGTVTGEVLDDLEEALRRADLDYLANEIPKAIEQSLEGVECVAGIVRAMKEFSHPGCGRRDAVDLNRAIRNTLTISHNEWKHVADVVTDFDPELPPVACLPGDLNQAILNVIINAAQAVADAVRHGPQPKGTITVRTRRDGDWVEVRIEDNGGGIAEDVRSKVFDPFFTTKEVGKGTGQGLAIAYSIITEKHGGTITFESEIGRGTCFIIRLPVYDSAPSTAERSMCAR